MRIREENCEENCNVVLISTLGGIEVFGLNGFVIGPLIAAMFMVSWEIFAASKRASGDGAAPEGP